MKRFFSYIKNSNVLVTLSLNPLKWRLYYHVETESDMDPGLLLDIVLTIGPIKIIVFIDDGSW